MNQRKVAYSGKKKKAQLQARRARKAGQEVQSPTNEPDKTPTKNKHVNFRLSYICRLSTVFNKESSEVVETRKLKSMKPLQRTNDVRNAVLNNHARPLRTISLGK